jgi:hypothetical protein
MRAVKSQDPKPELAVQRLRARVIAFVSEQVGELVQAASCFRVIGAVFASR